MLGRALRCGLRRRLAGFADSVALEPQLPPARRREAVIKICSMLGLRYLDFNEDIPALAQVKLIDDESNNFLGVYSAERAQELARRAEKDLMMFNAAVEPKICKLMRHRRAIYERFLREVVAKELRVSERVQARKGQAVRRIELSPRISLNDMTGKLLRLVAGARGAEGVCVMVEVREGVPDDARAVLQRAGKVLQGRAFPAERIGFVDERFKPVAESELSAPRRALPGEEDAPPRVFATQTFRFEGAKAGAKGAEEAPGHEYSESQLFELADEIFQKKGVAATSLGEVVEGFGEEEGEEEPAKQRINVPWLERLLRKPALQAGEGESIEKALRGLPELDAAVRAELARLNLPATEANLSAHVKRVSEQRNSQLTDLLRLFGFKRS